MTNALVTEPAPQRYLTSRQVRERYGKVSHMWIERRMRDASGFPQPVRLGGARRFWRLTDLEKWEAQRLAAAGKP